MLAVAFADRKLVIRALLASMSLVVLTLPALIVVGAYIPWAFGLGRFARVLNADPAWVPVGAALGCLLAAAALVLGGRRWTRGLFGLAALTTAGAIGIAAQLAMLAAQHGVHYDPGRTTSPTAFPVSTLVTFATVSGQDLHAAISKPPAGAPDAASSRRVGVVFVHGGSFVAGGLGARPALFGAFVRQGFVVIDIEYRLAPPARWQDAPSDVLCALAWLSGAAQGLGIDPQRVVIVGQSAGGNLALMAGYAAHDRALEPSCPGNPIVPAAVIAISPTADLAATWGNDLLADDGHRLPETYLGGTPAQFPDRYRRASPFWLLGPDDPPTLLFAGGIDPVVHVDQVRALADAIGATGAKVSLVVVPFADHGFDGPPDSFGEQLEETVMPAFIVESLGLYEAAA